MCKSKAWLFGSQRLTQDCCYTRTLGLIALQQCGCVYMCQSMCWLLDRLWSWRDHPGSSDWACSNLAEWGAAQVAQCTLQFFYQDLVQDEVLPWPGMTCIWACAVCLLERCVLLLTELIFWHLTNDNFVVWSSLCIYLSPFFIVLSAYAYYDHD